MTGRAAAIVAVLAIAPGVAPGVSLPIPDESDCARPIRKQCVWLSPDSGFQSAIAPFVADSYYPHSQEEARWRLSMEPYVPVILAGLASEITCERLAALELAVRAPADRRVLDALVARYREGPGTELRKKLLDGIAFQAKVLGTSEELRALMKAALRDPSLTMVALQLAEAVGRPEDVEEVGDAFLELGGARSPLAWAFVEKMKLIGGDGFPDVLRRALVQQPDARLAEALLRYYFPERQEEEGAWKGGDVVDFLTQDLGVALTVVDDRTLIAALFRASVVRYGSGEEKVRYWERCRAVFADRPIALVGISQQLARLYPATGDLERAVDTMRTMVELDPARAKYFLPELVELQCKLAAQRTSSGISAILVARTRDGGVEGRISGDPGTLRELSKREPVCFLDALDDAGAVVASVPARWVPVDRQPGIGFRLTPDEGMPYAGAIRARLLFLPKFPDDVRVALACELAR